MLVDHMQHKWMTIVLTDIDPSIVFLMIITTPFIFKTKQSGDAAD